MTDPLIIRALKSAAEYHVNELQDDAYCEQSRDILTNIKAALDPLGETVPYMDDALGKAEEALGPVKGENRE